MLIAERDNTTVILKSGRAIEPSQRVSKTVIEKIIAWLGSIDRYIQRGGIAFMGSGTARNANIPYRAKYAEIMPDADLLFSAMGMFGTAPGGQLDFATGLSYLTEAVKTMKDKPDISGLGVLKPEEYKSKVENLVKNDSVIVEKSLKTKKNDGRL